MAEKFTDLLGQEYKAEVLKFLKDNPDDFFSINEITEKTSGSNPSVKKFLEELSDIGLVKFRKKGGSYLIEYNPDSRYDEAVKSIFKVEIDELWRKASMYGYLLRKDDKIGEHIESVILYGSVARGTADSNSDIDILILTDGEIEEDEIMETALKISKEKSDEEVEIVPMVETIEEFQENWSVGTSRFETNVVRDGEILKGQDWDDILG